MACSAPDKIICRLDAGQWVAHFEQTPQVAYGGDLPIVSIRRLLEGTEAVPDTYTMICDQAGSDILLRSMIWDSPELLFRCPDCEGRGEYVGLLERRTCPTCQGRKVVPV